MPLIDKPTRFDPSNTCRPSLLDKIWFNKITGCEGHILLNDTTDHLPVYLSLPKRKNSKTNEKVKIRFRCNNSNNYDKFLKMLMEFNWAEIRSENINNYTLHFVTKLDEFYNECFPWKSKLVSGSHVCNAWMNANLAALINAKSTYYVLYRQGIVTREENSRFRNKVNSIVRKTKTNYYRTIFDKCRGNARQTWRNIKLISGRKIESTTIPKLVVDRKELTDPTEICEALNSHFCSIGTKLENSLPKINVDPVNFILNSSHSSIFLAPASPPEILKIISKLKNSNHDAEATPVHLIKKIFIYFGPCTNRFNKYLL